MEHGSDERMLPSAYGEVPTFTLEPEGDAPCPGVVVLHDAGGMTADLRRRVLAFFGEYLCPS